jgi:hypothetical protein
MIVSAITVTVIAKLNLRRMAGRIVVVIAMRALRRGGAPSYLMILFAPALSKPHFFPDRDPRSSTV